MLILGFSVSGYDSTKESSGWLRIGMLISVLSLSATSNVLAELYMDFLSSGIKTTSTVSVGRKSFFQA
jgi:hypothetical protein